jgi:hypothetical protein
LVVIQPATWSSAGSALMCLPRLPMAQAISASQSIFFSPRGISMSSLAPARQLGAFRNRYGSEVDFSPVNFGPLYGVMPERSISSTCSWKFCAA